MNTKTIEVQFHDIEFTARAYNQGNLDTHHADSDSVARVIRNYIAPYIPEVLHRNIQFDTMYFDYRLNAFAIKVSVNGTSFYFKADDVKQVYEVGSHSYTNFYIVSCDEESYLKEHKVMIKQVNQLKEKVERANRKKQENEKMQKELELLEKKSEQTQSLKVYYDESGEVDFLRTSRQALQQEGLL